MIRRVIKKITGFTVIELLVVIAIIGMLSYVVYAQLQFSRLKGKNAAIVLMMSSLHSLIDLEKYPGSLEDLCLDFEPGGEFGYIRAGIEHHGGNWNCDSTVGEYRIFAGLHQAVTLSQKAQFTNVAYADSSTHSFGNYYCLNSLGDKNFTHWSGDNLTYPSCNDTDYIPTPVDSEPTPEPTPDPEPVPDPPAESGGPSCSGGKVQICHFDKTICVSEKAWEKGHSKHGDTLGAC